MTSVSVEVSRAFLCVDRKRSALAVGALARDAGDGKAGRNGVEGAGRRLWNSRYDDSWSYDHCEGFATKAD